MCRIGMYIKQHKAVITKKIWGTLRTRETVILGFYRSTGRHTLLGAAAPALAHRYPLPIAQSTTAPPSCSAIGQYHADPAGALAMTTIWSFPFQPRFAGLSGSSNQFKEMLRDKSLLPFNGRRAITCQGEYKARCETM